MRPRDPPRRYRPAGWDPRDGSGPLRRVWGSRAGRAGPGEREGLLEGWARASTGGGAGAGWCGRARQSASLVSRDEGGLAGRTGAEGRGVGAGDEIDGERVLETSNGGEWGQVRPRVRARAKRRARGLTWLTAARTSPPGPHHRRCRRRTTLARRPRRIRLNWLRLAIIPKKLNFNGYISNPSFSVKVTSEAQRRCRAICCSAFVVGGSKPPPPTTVETTVDGYSLYLNLPQFPLPR